MYDTCMRLPVKYNNAFCYDIVLDQTSEFMKNELAQFQLTNRKLCIVTESTVGPLHAALLEQIAKTVGHQVFVFTFTAGEESKNLDTVAKLYEFLILHSFDRNDVLIALGGGVVGDLTGYTAATYLRGIRFFQAPTSLLAMVDSSIGGKTGVDFQAYKNMVGAFYMPSGVYMNLSALNTLPERQYLSGMGEIIKHGLIKDATYYEWLKSHNEPVKEKQLDTVMEMVKTSCEIKRAVVENDPKEQGERALLNFGHSIGHAVEKLKNFSLLHGECVAIGMVGAGYISMKRGYITKDELYDIITTMKSYSLPVSVTGLRIDDVIEVMSRDKKMDAGTLKFILLKSIGEAVIDTTVTIDEIKQAIEFVLQER